MELKTEYWEISTSKSFIERGTWMPQLVEHLIFDFSSVHDLSSSQVRLGVESTEPVGDSLFTPPLLALSVSKINKFLKNNKNKIK